MASVFVTAKAIYKADRDFERYFGFSIANLGSRNSENWQHFYDMMDTVGVPHSIASKIYCEGVSGNDSSETLQYYYRVYVISVIDNRGLTVQRRLSMSLDDIVAARQKEYV